MSQEHSTDIRSTTAFINNIYDKQTYFDLYGTSVGLFVLITIALFYVVVYYQISTAASEIADNWPANRCNPKYMPFAGFIMKPTNMTQSEYTEQNFQQCSQTILENITGYALEPIQYAVSGITAVYGEFSDAINETRKMTNELRTHIANIIENIFDRIITILIPLQQIFLAIIDVMGKVQGVMTTTLYTMMGSYYSLQALMGGILQMMINVLVLLIIIIAGLWVVPFTWPMAGALSSVFASIAIPLAIIVVFMSDVMHIHAGGIPKLRCFDKQTMFMMNNNTFKTIDKLVPGDILYGNVKITATMKVLSTGVDMFKINNVVVSGNHKMIYNDRVITVKSHPFSEPIHRYYSPYLYCINTDTKTIKINDMVFGDWDELIGGKNMDAVINHICKDERYNGGIESFQPAYIHKYLDGGFVHNKKICMVNGMKNIGDICVGDYLENANIVYGVVRVDSACLSNDSGNTGRPLYHLLTTEGKFVLESNTVSDYNHYIDSIV